MSENKQVQKTTKPPAGVFLDHNAGGPMPAAVVEQMVEWVNRGNPSSNHPAALEARDLIASFRELIASTYNFTQGESGEFTIIFNSGASESNSHVITAAVDAAAKENASSKKMSPPHVVASEVEHKSVLLCLQALKEDKRCDYTLLPVSRSGKNFGSVEVADVKAALRPETCLICIMAANNETGAISDLGGISAVAQAAGVPFYTDATQYLPRSPLFPNGAKGEMKVDAFCASFHKMQGPQGSGMLVIRNSFPVRPLVYGVQNNWMRGGTESVHNLAAARLAFSLTYKNRKGKNTTMAGLVRSIQNTISKAVVCCHLDEYKEDAKTFSVKQGRVEKPTVVWISPASPWNHLPNTLLLSLSGCSEGVQIELAKRGVIVSVGSACNSSAESPSGIVQALGLPDSLKKGLLRISLGDSTSERGAFLFVKEFLDVIAKKT